MHVVRAGESLTVIAQQYGTTVEVLTELNALENPDSLQVGQVLELPSS